MEPFYVDDLGTLYNGDSRELIKQLPDESVNCIVTSPPYFGLRDYGTAKWEGGDINCTHEYQKGGRKESSKKQTTNDGTQFSQYERKCKKCGAVRVDNQIGLEETPDEYVNRMVELLRECKRVLREDGTLWLNIGDSYSNKEASGIKAKDLIGIPWMLAFALRADGWYLRNDIIWAKPNPMPESVRDRCTKSHEHIFLFSKNGGNPLYWKAKDTGEWSNSPDLSETIIEFNEDDYGNVTEEETSRWVGYDYYFDNIAIAEPAVWTAKHSDGKRGNVSKEGEADLNPQRHGNRMSGRVIGQTQDGHVGAYNSNGEVRANLKEGKPVRNKRDVWFDGRESIVEKIINAVIDSNLNDDEKKAFIRSALITEPTVDGDIWKITPKAFKGAHFATFPKDLVEPCILAGCPEGGVVLDPFFGAGTTGVVAEKLSRRWLGLELNENYCNMAIDRIIKERNNG